MKLKNKRFRDLTEMGAAIIAKMQSSLDYSVMGTRYRSLMGSSEKATPCICNQMITFDFFLWYAMNDKDLYLLSVIRRIIRWQAP